MRLLRAFVLALSGALVLTPFLLGVVSMWGITHPPCNAGSDPGWFNSAYEDVRFSSTNGLEQQGFFIPGTNGATIILVPAFNSGRGAELHYARVFNDGGFNVLSFNSRVCGHPGWISLGYYEVEDVEAAYAYLRTRGEVDMGRVGLHGFSSAGATALMATARMPEIRSVTAEGGYHHYADMLGVGTAGNLVDTLYQIGASASYRLITGNDINSLSPFNAIDEIAPRPVLLIYGSEEVSLTGARLMLERALKAGVQAELWVVERAGHGNYLGIAPDEFVRRVVGFHQAALLDPVES